MRSDELEVDEYNPGEELQRLLKKIYPPDTEGRTSFIQRIDSGLRAEGDFAELVYDSCINYMVRRLITTAEYIRDMRREGRPDPDRRFGQSFRISFAQTELFSKATERSLVCCEVRSVRNSSNGQYQERIRAEDRIGACDVTYVDEPDLLTRTRASGAQWPTRCAASQDLNLRVACPSSKSKADFVDASDSTTNRYVCQG